MSKLNQLRADVVVPNQNWNCFSLDGIELNYLSMCACADKLQTVWYKNNFYLPESFSSTQKIGEEQLRAAECTASDVCAGECKYWQLGLM